MKWKCTLVLLCVNSVHVLSVLSRMHGMNHRTRRSRFGVHARWMDGWRVGAPATRPPHTRARSGHTHARTMAFILGGFSHLFAFKGAFQAEVRASSRETRRPPASRMTTTTTTKGDATRAATDEWNGMDDDDDDAGGCG